MTEYTPEQIKEHRRRWVEELKSGNWPQTQKCLMRVKGGEYDSPLGYCCLGVATVISEVAPQVETTNGVVSFASTAWYSDTNEHERHPEFTLLPRQVAEYLGVSCLAPNVFWKGKWVSLTHLNDNFGFTLPQIGVVIEAQSDTWLGGEEAYASGDPEWWDADRHMSVIPRPEVG